MGALTRRMRVCDYALQILMLRPQSQHGPGCNQLATKEMNLWTAHVAAGELIVGWRTAAARGVLSNICALRGVTLEFQDAFNLDCVLVGALQQE